jgi:hypothetical protein
MMQRRVDDQVLSGYERWLRMMQMVVKVVGFADMCTLVRASKRIETLRSWGCCRERKHQAGELRVACSHGFLSGACRMPGPR